MADGAKRRLHISRIGRFLNATIAVNDELLVASSNSAITAIALLLIFYIFQMLAEPPLVRPYGIGTSIGILTLSSIDDEQLVDVAVTVPVVHAPVDVLRLQDIYNVIDQILRVFVVRRRAVILHKGAGQIDINKVERKVEHAIALGIEIIVDRANKRALMIVLGIENIIPLGEGCSHVALKGLVAESGQHHQLTTVAMIKITTRLKRRFLRTLGAHRWQNDATTARTYTDRIFCRYCQRDE